MSLRSSNPAWQLIAFLVSILVYAVSSNLTSGTVKGSLCTAGTACPRRCSCTLTPSGNSLVNCGSKGMLELPTALPANTEIFIFTNNKLAALSADTFGGCHNLLHLDLSSNCIKNLSEAAFRGIDQLQMLLLNNNTINFNTAPGKLWQFVPLLSNLSIHDNSDKSDQATSYNDQLFVPLKNLRNLTMDGLQNASFGAGFSSLKRLEYLTMLGDFRYITNDTFRSLSNSSLKTFMARSWVLTDVDVLAFAHFKQLQVLDLSFNPTLGFPNVSKSWYGLQFTSISELVLERSAPYDYQIITIERAFFKYLELTRLKKLVLDANNIITIDAVFSFHTRHLEYLSFAHNRLVQVLGLVLDVFFLPNLTTLQVSFQSRRLLTPDEWPKGKGPNHFADQETNILRHSANSNLSEESGGELASNATNLPILGWERARGYIPTLFSNYTLLRELHYRGTLLIEGVGYISKTMPIPAGPMYMLSPPRLRNFQAAASLTMDYDTFRETTLFGINQLQTINYSQNNVRNLVGPFIIKSPPPYKLVVDFSENDCTYLDSNFSFHIGDMIGTVLLGQNNLGNQLAHDTNGTLLKYYSEMTWLDLASNNIKNLPFDVFKHQSRLQHLDLSYNSLRLTDFAIEHMANLSFLDLSGNLLDQLSFQTRASLDLAARSRRLTVDLSENPLQCSCETLGFLKWMPHSKVELVNWKSYECMYNGRLVRLSNLESVMLPKLQVDCHSKTWVIAAAVVLVGIILTILVSSVLYRYRFEIRYLCLRLVIKRRQYQALEEEDTEYDFDAFVAFDQSDLQWINEHLIQHLDSKDGEGEFKLLLHHRDFLPGERIDENILRGIQNSRKIVLVLSRHFVESHWCDWELQMAQTRCFDEGKELVVPILLEEDFPTLKLTRSLRLLLRRNTYLMWPEDLNERDNFWLNLKRALASKSDRIIRCQCGQTMTV